MSEHQHVSRMQVPNSRAWLGFAVSLCYVGCAALAALLALSVRNDTVHVRHGLWIRLVLGLSGCLLLGLAWLLARASRGTHRPRQPPCRRRAARSFLRSDVVRAALDPGISETVAGSDPDLGRNEQIRGWVTGFCSRYREAELSKTAHIALAPGRYVQRAVQTVSLNELCTVHQVTREVRIPGGPTEGVCRVVVPILTVPKGSMVDGLDVECNGASGLTLGYQESQGAALWLAWLLMHRAGVKDERLYDALLLVASEVASPEVPLLRSKMTDTVELDSSVHLEAEAFVGLLSTHRIIFAEVEARPGARVSLKVRWSSNRHDRFHSVADVARAVFGLGPTSIAGAAVGTEAASWHLRVNAPLGTHMKRVSLYVRPDTDPQRAFVLSSNGVAGRELAHVRVRRLGPPQAVRVPTFFRAHLGETPPGIGGPLAIISLALAAMIWGFGVFYNHAFPAAQESASSASVLTHPGGISAAAILAGISAVSAWLVSRFSDEAVRRAQLREVFALLVVMATSGAALFSAALRLAQIQLVEPRHSTALGASISIPNTTWAVLMMLSGCLAAMAWGGLTARVLRLQRMIARSRQDAF